MLRDTAERLDDPGLPIRSPTGDPGERIVEVAGSEGHDLVVVGNNGMAGAMRFLLIALVRRPPGEAASHTETTTFPRAWPLSR